MSSRCNECDARIAEAESAASVAASNASSNISDNEACNVEEVHRSYRQRNTMVLVAYALTLVAGLTAYYLWSERNLALWRMASQERAAKAAIEQLHIIAIQ